MRDFIWTLIIIWTVYQLSSLFRNRKKTAKTFASGLHTGSHAASGEKTKDTLRKASDSEGDYVDFEEVK